MSVVDVRAAATGARGGELGASPVLDDGLLEFGERAEDVKDELFVGCFGVEAFGQRPEADLATFEVFNGLDELFYRPGEPIESPRGEHLAGAHVVDYGHRIRPVPLRAGRGFGLNPVTSGLLQRVELEGGILAAGWNLNVLDKHENDSEHSLS